MVMNEETIIVSEAGATEGDTIIVKEALEPLPMAPSPPEKLPTMNESEPLPFPEGSEDEQRTDSKPKGWLESQEAKDFEPFLVSELKRIKQPAACARSINEAERSLGQYKRLNIRVSKALQSDDDGVLNISNIDKLRQSIEQHIDTLERMLESHHDMKRRRKQVRRRASDDSCPTCAAPLWEDGENLVCLACGSEGIKKEAGTPAFTGMSIQISSFENAITGILINSTVSGGRNMEEMYEKLNKKYSFTDREELAILQILADKGFPIFKDRSRLDEDEDPTDPKKPREWLTNYYA